MRSGGGEKNRVTEFCTHMDDRGRGNKKRNKNKLKSLKNCAIKMKREKKQTTETEKSADIKVANESVYQHALIICLDHIFTIVLSFDRVSQVFHITISYYTIRCCYTHMYGTRIIIRFKIHVHTYPHSLSHALIWMLICSLVRNIGDFNVTASSLWMMNI